MTGTNRLSIPQARDRLRELAEEHDLPELSDLADQMYRKSPKKRAKNKSATVTAALANKIREYADLHPDAHQREVGQEFNVNPGRVSESANHQR